MSTRHSPSTPTCLSLDRRRFLGASGAGALAAVLASCTVAGGAPRKEDSAGGAGASGSM